MILAAALATGAAAIAAIGGSESLEANVREVESSRAGGSLYASLGTWGVILMIVAVAEATAAVSIWRGTPNRILAGLSVAYVGLLCNLFTLVILRATVVPTIVLLFAAVYVLTYRSGRRPGAF